MRSKILLIMYPASSVNHLYQFEVGSDKKYLVSVIIKYVLQYTQKPRIFFYKQN